MPVIASKDARSAACGPTVLEFGNDWCGRCRAAQPAIAEALAALALIASP